MTNHPLEISDKLRRLLSYPAASVHITLAQNAQSLWIYGHSWATAGNTTSAQDLMRHKSLSRAISYHEIYPPSRCHLVVEIHHPNTLQTVQRVILLNPNRRLPSVGRPRGRRLVLRDLLLQSLKKLAKGLARQVLSLPARTLCRLK